MPPITPPSMDDHHNHGPPDPHNTPTTPTANHLSLSLPLLPPSSNPRLLPKPPNAPADLPHPPPDRPSRDDCWSEDATNTLIDAWGDRYLDLNRGNLKQKHWKDVADSVNARADAVKPRKTDVQCKNRLDTLKKKYKLEKSKIVTGGGPSKWPFFERLDELVGPSKKQKKPTPVKVKLLDSKPHAEEIEQKPVFNTAIVNYTPTATNDNDNNINNNDNVNNTTTDTLSKSKESPDMTDSCPHGHANAGDGKTSKKRRLVDSPFRDLARSILKFGEVYERIESAKQQQLIELERQRMEFTKDLELQRMQLFMQTQLELAKLKHGKHGSTEHYL